MEYSCPDVFFSRRGVACLTTLALVMIMGIMLAKTGQSWQQLMQREKEQELLFRGSQIQTALNRWHYPAGAQHVATPLSELNYLLRDPRVPGTVRHLRRLYGDPMTNSPWELIRDPVRGIIGIRSSSLQRPFKLDGFPENLKQLTNKKSYREWEFIARATYVPAVDVPRPVERSPHPVIQ